MAKFGYTSKRTMDPRPGKTYATEYYKQSRSERRRTLDHIETTIARVYQHASDTDTVPGLNAPMPRFQRKETKGAYSIVDILSDLLTQMKSGKDIPSGMLGRWNRLFEGTNTAIEMVLESELPPKHPILGDLDQ
jgi:hypothetical protein